MDRVQGSRLLVLVDDARDVPFRRTLRDRADVDVLLAERIEDFSRDARSPLHALPNDGENGLISTEVDVHETLVELEAELVCDGVSRASRVRVPHGKADGVLRRGLGNENDVDAS